MTSTNIPQFNADRGEMDFAYRLGKIYYQGSIYGAPGGAASGGDGASIMSDSPGPSTAAPGRGRFANAVRAVIKMRTASAAFPVEGRNPRRQRTMSSDGNGNGREAEPVGVLKNSRVGTLMPKLRSLQTTQSFEAHSALVRHLQFSPNGKFLATSR